MKKISWKRIIAITGIVALLFSNLSDVVTVFADDTVQAAEAAATEQEAQVQAQQESEPVQVTQSPAEPAAQDENQDNNQDNNRDEAASGDDTSVTTDGSETAASSSSNKEEESETAASGTSGKEDGADGASSTDAATEASSDAAEEASTTEAADTSESSASDKSAVVEKPEEAATGKTILTEVDNTVSVKGTCKAGDETIKGHESFAIEVSGTTNPSSFAPSIDGYTFTGEVTLDDNKVSKIRKETKEETTTSERTVTNNTESESVDAEAGSEDNSGSADQNTETPATLAAPENSGTASSSESSESASTTVTDTNITKTTFISYSTDGESYTKLTSDTTLVFHYTKDAVAEKKTIAIYGKCVDTDNAVIKNYEKKELTVDDTLDLTKAPFEIDGYTYKEAKIDDAVVSSIDKKTEAADDSKASGSEEASSDSSSEEANTNAGSEGSARNSSNDSSSSTVTYSYTADGKTHELTEDTTITFVYEAEKAPVVALKATYVDKYGDAIDKDHTDVDLPEFEDDVLTIAAGEDDVLPEKIQVEKGSNKKVIEYTYAKSYVKISGSVKTITSIKREKMDDGYAYYVKGVDDSEYTALKKDTTVYFRYTDGSKSEYTYEDSKVKVTATLQHANAIPDDAEFKVTPVTKSSKDYNYDAYMAALNDNADKLGADSSSSSKTSDSADAFNEDNTLLYDIAFMGHPVKDDGTVDEDKDIEFQPAEGSVKIEIEFKKDQLSEELGATEDDDVIVAHLPLTNSVKNENDTTAEATDISASDVKVEEMSPTASVENGTVGFTAVSFCVFGFTKGYHTGNYWNGNSSKSVSALMDNLGLAKNAVIYADTLTNYSDHFEGCIVVNHFVDYNNAQLNQDARMLYNNQINKITVTKNVDKAESSDREFTFGFYKNADGSGDSVATISVTVSANKKTGSHTISMNSEKDNEPFYSLRTSNLYLYEIDEKDNVVSNGGIYQDNSGKDLYTVNYVSSSDSRTDDNQKLISAEAAFANYIGNITNNHSGTQVNTKYFGDPSVGFQTYFATDTAERNYPMKPGYSEKKDLFINDSAGNMILYLNSYFPEDTSVTASDYFHTLGVEGFENATGINANINGTSPAFGKISENLANDAKFGTVSGTSDFNTINVISTKGNLTNDLDAVGFKQTDGASTEGNRGIEDIIKESEDQDEYLLINIDATDFSEYTINQLFVDGVGADSDNEYPRQGSHIVYNLLQKSGDKYVPYTGTVLTSGVVVGMIFAPEATVKQFAKVNGSIVAKNVERVSGCGEVHQKSFGSGSTRSIEMSVSNSGATGSLIIKKNVLVNGNTTTTKLADGTYNFIIKGTKDTSTAEVSTTATVKIENGVSNTATVSGLVPGEYTVTENMDGLTDTKLTTGKDGQKVTVVAGATAEELKTAEFTNDKTVKGSLIIKKNVLVNGNTTTTKLADGTYNFIIKGTKDTSTAEVSTTATVKIENGVSNTATVSGLVPGEYTVTENMDGLTDTKLTTGKDGQKVTVVAGATAEELKTAEFTNDKTVKGSLIIKKNVLVNGNTTTTKLADGTYNFIIKGTKDTSTAEVSTTATVKIENGVSNTATVSGLVPGEYTVTENMDGLTDTKLTTGKDGQKVTVVAGATAEELKTAEFTNDKTVKGSLIIKKNVLVNGNTTTTKLADGTYNFIIKGTKDTSTAEVSTTATVKIENGVSNTATVSGLVPGEYTVTENMDGLTDTKLTTGKDGQKVTVVAGATAEELKTAEFTNDKTVKGSLIIKKNVLVNGNTTTTKLADGTYNFIIKGTKDTSTAEVSTTATVKIENGVSNTATVSGLVPGEYTVTENMDGLTDTKLTTGKDGQKVTVVAGATAEELKTAEFTNDKTVKGSLIIKKNVLVNGNTTTTKLADGTYNFIIKGTKDTSTAEVSTTATVKIENGVSNTATVSGLVPGEYTVTENMDGLTDTKLTTGKDGQKVTVVAGATAEELKTAEFTNDKTVKGSLIIKKNVLVNGNTTTTKLADGTYNFIIKGTKDTSTAEVSTTATVKIENGVSNTATVSGLVPGEYTVTENMDGLTDTKLTTGKDGQKVTVVAGATAEELKTAEFTNDKTVKGSLIIKKNVLVNGNTTTTKLADGTYNFIIKGTKDTSTAEVSTTATVKIENGVSNTATVSGLVPGEYTVTENMDGLTDTKLTTGKDGQKVTVVAGATAEELKTAEFTNDKTVKGSLIIKKNVLVNGNTTTTKLADGTYNFIIKGTKDTSTAEVSTTATVKIENGVSNTATVSGLVPGEYTVTENMDGLTDTKLTTGKDGQKVTVVAGATAEELKTAEFTNDKTVKGSLIIKKNVLVNGNTTTTKLADGTYNFIIKGTKDTSTAEVSTTATVKIENGVSNTATVSGLVPGEYTVTENMDGLTDTKLTTGKDGQKVTVVAGATAEELKTAEFTNDKTVKGSLIIKKNVLVNGNTTTTKLADGTYNFIIKGTKDTSTAEVSTTATVKIENGVSNTATVSGLVPGEYTVTENMDGLTDTKLTTGKDGQKVTVVAGATAEELKTAEFTNDKTVKGSLIIKKNVLVNGNTTTTKLADGTYNFIIKGTKDTSTAEVSTTATVKIENGVSNTATVSGLVPGEYTVTENMDGLTDTKLTTGKDGQKVTVVAGATAEELKTAEFTNDKTVKGSLIIKKNVLVNGNTTTTKLADGTYNFIIKGTKDTSTAEVSTTATVKIENGVSNTATVSGLVPGEYTVTENMDGLTDTKLTTGKDGQKVTVVAGATAEELKTAEFTNDKTVKGSLIIKKNVLVNGNTTTTKLADGTYNFIIKGTKDTSTAEVSTTATVKIENGVSNTATVSGLVPGEYTVTENMDGLTDTKLTTGKDGQKVTVVAGATAEELKTAEFTNDKTVKGSLIIKKNVLVNGNTTTTKLADGTYNFIIKGTKDTSTAEVSTTATVKIENGVSNTATVSGLVPGEYTVTENMDGLTDTKLTTGKDGQKVTVVAGATAEELKTAEFTNDKTAVVSLSVEKNFLGSGNELAKINKVELQLLANSMLPDNSGTGITVADNGYKTLTTSTTAINGYYHWGADELKASWSNLPKYDNSGNEITYTVKEINNNDSVYKVYYNGAAATSDSTASFDENGVVRITNCELTSVSGTKTWNDSNNQDSKRPSSITIRLLANGTEISNRTVTANDGWAWSFGNLLKYSSEGKEISYTITEDAVADYGTQINGYNVTNTYTPGKTSVTVTKVWNDENNKDNIRPGSVSVQLYADGTAKGDVVTLSAFNNWRYTWTGLDQKNNGNDISYTVDEVSVPSGYSKSVSGNASSGFTITNTHTPSTPKTPTTPNTPTDTTTTVGQVLGSALGVMNSSMPISAMTIAGRSAAATGDDSNMETYGAITVTGLAGLLAWLVVFMKKKRKQEKHN